MEWKYVIGGLPGQSNFYTTISGLNRSGFSAQKLWNGLQVKPFRTEIGIYKVRSNTPAAFGTTYANQTWGAGGLPQVFISNLEDIELIYSLPLKQ